MKEGFFGNEGSGTRVELTGLLDGLRPEKVVVDELGIPGRQNAVLEGRLKQDFSAIQLSLEEVELSGKAAFPFRLTSGDFNVFRISGVLEAEQLSAKLPEAGIQIHNLNGAIPLEQEFGIGPGGTFQFLSKAHPNLLSVKQFADIQPFLSSDNFFALDELVIGDQSLAPIAGNMRIEDDQISLDQLRIGYRGGNIFGQVIVQGIDEAPKAYFKGNITGVRPSRE